MADDEFMTERVERSEHGNVNWFEVLGKEAAIEAADDSEHTINCGKCGTETGASLGASSLRPGPTWVAPLGHIGDGTRHPEGNPACDNAGSCLIF